MSTPIDFYFDFASPYAYFLSGNLEALAAKHEREIRWHPVLLWAVLKQVGLPPPMESETKKRYMMRDIERSARFYGVPYRQPDPFPVSSHLPARLFYHLRAGDETLAERFAKRVFAAYFTENMSLSDAAAVAAIAASVGIDAKTASEGISAEAAKNVLRDEIAGAERRGVWGSPFVFIDDEPFFGADRLPQMEFLLQGRA
jgi:2-hydroxychromene-2-carboxylate isomerase